MKCYTCEKTVRSGGTRLAVADAIGICHDCGVAVCIEHGRKSKEPGAPLLCPGCAEKREKQETPIRADPELAHQNA
jgi:hypothetical protein